MFGKKKKSPKPAAPEKKQQAPKPKKRIVKKRPAPKKSKNSKYTPEMADSYGRARMEWENRLGQSRAAVRNWSIMSVIMMILTALIISAYIEETNQIQIEAYIVEVDEYGIPKKTEKVDQKLDVTQQQIRTIATNFVRDLREISLDPLINQKRVGDLYFFVTPDGGRKIWTDYKKSDQMNYETQYVNDITGARTVKIKSVKEIPPDKLEIRWEETTFNNTAVEDKNAYIGEFTYIVNEPIEDKKLNILRNPLGIYISDFKITEDF